MPADWPQKTLADITAEDLSKVKKPVLLDGSNLTGPDLLAAIAAL